MRFDFAPNAFEISDDGRSAGTPEQRANDIHAAFEDHTVAAVMSAAGGNSTHEVLTHLDAGRLRAHPKAFIGQSDNTFINAFLYSQAGIISYTGLTFATNFGESNVSAAAEEVLLGYGPLQLRSSSIRTPNLVAKSQAGDVVDLDVNRPGVDVWLQSGRAEARLVGGGGWYPCRFNRGRAVGS